MLGDYAFRRLSDRQRREVADNIGLVAKHLEQHLALDVAPTRDREWDDLFQEGCVGLIEAVRTFRAESGIDFPAYAMPRIHSAVGRALRGAFATVRAPLYPRGRPLTGASAPPPVVQTLDFDPQDRRPQVRHATDGAPHGETIGERLRDRYVETVERVVRRMPRLRPARGDRPEVIQRIVDERLLIPDEDARTSLRAIARESHSSYARIAKCEKCIIDQVRADLDDDAETQRLRQAARRKPDGMDRPIDSALRDELECMRVDRLCATLEEGPPRERAERLVGLFACAGVAVADAVRAWLMALTPDQRAACLAVLRYDA
ncbi:MAG TPA: sigma factor [Phycisphaerae bacterium]|nr:sigma factor [Phycisphaerae bacterium]